MEADLVAAQHGVVPMEKELTMVEAETTYQRAVIARTERLFNAGAVSRQEYESDRAMAVSTDATLEAARAKLEQARAMQTSALKKLDAAGSMGAPAQAPLRTAEGNRGECAHGG